MFHLERAEDTIRLSRTTDGFVAAAAQRTRRSKGAIVEALTEEAA